MRSPYSRSWNLTLATGVLLGWAAGLPVQASVDLSNVPLFLSSSVPPNVVVTLDTSTSMYAAHTPDSPDGGTGTKRYKSAYFNPMYYNPALQYLAPLKFDGSATTTSFTAANINGFDPTRGSTTNASAACNPKGTSGTKYSPVNLETNYAATYNYGPDSDTQSCTSAEAETTTTTYPPVHYSHVCQVDFDNSGSNDRLHIDSGCLNAFTSTVVGTVIIVTNSSRNGSYTITNLIDSNTVVVGNPWSNDLNNQSGVRLEWDYTPPPVTVTNYPAHYYLFYSEAGVSRPASCPAAATNQKNDDNCYVRRIVGSADDTYHNPDGSAASAAQKQQNFANWYSFYRTRTLALISGADRAFWDMSSTMRVAWQNLNVCNDFTGTNCAGRSGTKYANSIKEFSGSHRDDFFKWLFDIDSTSGTPLRVAVQRAGEYFSTASGLNNPYAAHPQVEIGTEHSCRKNYHILMTDGEWNTSGESGLTNRANADGTATTLPDGIAFSSGIPPYSDANSNGLADVIFHYWKTDLRGDLTNNLSPYFADRSGTTSTQYFNPKNDPATWQHMVTFTVGLGLSSQLTDPIWGGSTYAGDYPALIAGTKAWPSTSTTAGKIYDLWHGALNARGQFFSVEDPGKLVEAFNSILSAIELANPSFAALSADSRVIRDGTRVYQARFDTSDWHGQLLAYPVQGDGSIGTAYWDAASLVPAHGDRDLFTWDGSAGRPFTSCTAASMSAAQILALNTDASGTLDNRCADRVAWLRGNPAGEQRNGGTLRDRPVTVLGDIIDSDPAFVAAEDLGYSAGSSALTSSEKDSYVAFVTNKAARLPMIYVGANDGMLHAIRADIGNTTESGKELFGFIPQGVYANLSRLTDPNYSHRYFVDGAPHVGDAYVDGGWATILVSGLGAGGRSVFALDVTDPSDFSDSKVLWEFQDPDLGYSFSQPQIARLASGDWVAVFGNGYNSNNDRAYLYVVRLSDGVQLAKIAAGEATGNGLSTPVVYDRNGDKISDYAYVGDLLGNLWKFDLTSLELGNGGAPLFTAVNAASEIQPITVKPAAGGHPRGGAMIYFGTGRYLATGDPNIDDVQTFYAIWDNEASVSRDELQVQTILSEVNQFGLNLRDTSNDTVDWDLKRGWYLDLISPSGVTGERVIRTALLVYDRVLFTTAIPSTDPCQSGGQSWLMEMDAVTGGRTQVSVFDLNGDLLFDDGDKLSNSHTASGIKSEVGILSTPVWLDSGTAGIAYKETSGTTGGIMTIRNRAPVTSVAPTRKYWRQIL